MSQEQAPAPQGQKKFIRSFFFGGLLPVIAFTVIEERYGTVAGIIAGMVFGLGEVIWELISQKSVSVITWAGNGLILVLGAVSLIAKEGIWFKLQPAVMELIMAVVLCGSVIFNKPLLVALAEKQRQNIHPAMKPFMKALTFRIGCFFAAHAVLATWAAFKWSTEAWAILKGVGFTLSMVLYMVVEGYYLRTRARKILQSNLST